MSQIYALFGVLFTGLTNDHNGQILGKKLALLEQLTSECFLQRHNANVLFQKAVVPLQTARKSDTSGTLDLMIFRWNRPRITNTPCGAADMYP